MTYTLVWRNEARQALSRLRSADPTSAKLVIAAVRALATEPNPDTSSQLGQSRFRRLKLTVRGDFADPGGQIGAKVHLKGRTVLV